MFPSSTRLSLSKVEVRCFRRSFSALIAVFCTDQNNAVMSAQHSGSGSLWVQQAVTTCAFRCETPLKVLWSPVRNATEQLSTGTLPLFVILLWIEWDCDFDITFRSAKHYWKHYFQLPKGLMLSWTQPKIMKFGKRPNVRSLLSFNQKSYESRSWRCQTPLQVLRFLSIRALHRRTVLSVNLLKYVRTRKTH